MKMTATSQLLHNNNFKATILSLHEYMPETYGNETLHKQYLPDGYHLRDFTTDMTLPCSTAMAIHGNHCIIFQNPDTYSTSAP